MVKPEQQLVKAEQRRKRLESEDLSERDQHEAERGRDLIKKQLNFDTGAWEQFLINSEKKEKFDTMTKVKGFEMNSNTGKL